MTAQALLDALHEELLVDVRELVTTVAALKADLPLLNEEVLSSAKAVQSASRQSVEEFRAMGQGLITALRTQVRDERDRSTAAVETAATVTRAALSQFTKHLWLIMALAAFNVVLLVAMLATR